MQWYCKYWGAVIWLYGLRLAQTPVSPLGSQLQMGLALPYLFSASYHHGYISSCPSCPLIPFLCCILSLRRLSVASPNSYCSSPLVLCPPHLCASYSLSLSPHSQYGIYNEGACYVRSNRAVWTLSGDVQIQQCTSKPATANKSFSHLWYKAPTGHAKVLDCPLLSKISSCDG